MAAALSRALKLPGKKGSELGEYDPLTQADSEDESEEDDLVLNYPRNGLGGDSCHSGGSSKVRGGRPGRLVGAEDDEALEDDDDEDDDDEWRERLPSKSRPDRDDVKGLQYWSHRDSGNDEERGGSGGSLGGGGMGVHGAEAEAKRMRMKNAIRSAFFLVPVLCATLIVLLCAFLIPCEKLELQKRLQWEIAQGDVGGVTPHALAMWDVNGDSQEDVFLGVTEFTNDTHPQQGSKVYSAVALSAIGGQVLWTRVMHESVMYIQCGLQVSSQSQPTVLLIGKSLMTAVNGSTGETVWSVALKNIEYQALLLPDLQGDSVPDLLVATLPADENLDLSLNLISGKTGARLGDPVPYNLTGQGKLIGPLLHETPHGAYYILCGLGNVAAISLRDIYIRATGKPPINPALNRNDPQWEGLSGKPNSSSLIHIYRGSERVDFLLPLVAGFGNRHDSLDTMSNLNTSRSDWVLVYGTSKVSVLRQKDLHKEWTFSSPVIHKPPAPGHFNDDGVLDLFIEHSAKGIMQAQVIDGAEGHRLWMAEFVCPRLVLETSTITTSTGQSAFLFWASEPIKAQKNGTTRTGVPGIATAEPLIRKLFLLHPMYPTILIELTSTTDTALTSAVSYQERQKDATYITVSARTTPDSVLVTRIVKSMSLRAAIAKGRIVRLVEGPKTGEPAKPGAYELNQFFRRLSFKRQ